MKIGHDQPQNGAGTEAVSRLYAWYGSADGAVDVNYVCANFHGDLV